jgi:integrase
MATLFRNSNSPYYRARFYDENGKRISRTTGTTKKRDAQRIADGYQAEVDARKQEQGSMPRALGNVVAMAARKAASGKLTLKEAEDLVCNLHRIANPDFKDHTLQDWYALWIENQEQYVSATTLKGYQNDRKIIIEAGGPRVAGKKLTKLTIDDVRKCMTKAHERVRAATVNKALGSLRRAIEEARQQDLVVKNVASEVRLLKETDSTQRGPFTKEEVGLMLKDVMSNESFFTRGINNEWYGLILLGVFTGMRLGDLLKLSSDHIVGQHLEVITSKTGHEIKSPLSAPCLEWVKKKKGKFFPKLSVQKPGTTSTQFTRIMKRGGVARDIQHAGDLTLRRSFHSLRHTFTSWLADANVAADVRQRLTGHKSAGVHARYTHHDEALDRAVASLPTDFI